MNNFNTYYADILKGVYGEIEPKHQKLAQILSRKKVNQWEDVRQYMGKFSKYDNWTLRDIDKTFALLK